MKNRIPATVLPIEELLFTYYIKGLPTQIAMWVKRAHKETMHKDLCEAIQEEKDMFCLKDNHDTSSEQASTSCKKVDNFPKSTATSQDPFNMNDMKKVLQKMSNEMVDLKKTITKIKLIIGGLQGHLSNDPTNLLKIHHISIPMRDSLQKKSFLF